MNKWGSHMNKQILIIIHVPFRNDFPTFQPFFAWKISTCVWKTGGVGSPASIRPCGTRHRPTEGLWSGYRSEHQIDVLWTPGALKQKKAAQKLSLLWNSKAKQFFLMVVCFNWMMIPNHYMKKWLELTKPPLKNGCLGFQALPLVILTWWQLKHVFFFHFSHTESWGGTFPIWRLHIFSDGLKPPTSSWFQWKFGCPNVKETIGKWREPFSTKWWVREEGSRWNEKTKQNNNEYI